MDGLGLLDQARAAGLVVTAEEDMLVITGPKSAGPIAQALLADKTTVLSALALEAAEADYERLGAQVDDLHDRATAARGRGDSAEGERLGAECRALVVGPYLEARRRYAALLESEG